MAIIKCTGCGKMVKTSEIDKCSACGSIIKSASAVSFSAFADELKKISLGEEPEESVGTQ
jgi:hypothetical protein